MIVIAWLSLQFGATLKHLAVLLGREGGGSPLSETRVRQHVRRWVDLGLVRCVRPSGVVWVTPSEAGYALAQDRLGLRFSSWNAPASREVHCDWVNWVRLWYESDPKRVASTGPWTSERALYVWRADERWHVADGESRRPGDRWATAYEVELHCKRPAKRYFEEVVSRLRPDVGTLVYLCPDQIKNAVQQSVEGAVAKAGREGTLHVFFRPLPDPSTLLQRCEPQ